MGLREDAAAIAGDLAGLRQAKLRALLPQNRLP